MINNVREVADALKMKLKAIFCKNKQAKLTEEELDNLIYKALVDIQFLFDNDDDYDANDWSIDAYGHSENI